ncbi:disulfide bond formation protein DsbB [Rhodobacter viridis]|uniref:Disulfide bond formation protein DsbB n=1 Tax=Rhodobacter viridis TaxID=1054202 RepID=A0A318UAJ5_9RHOB|nr:disulfide bond formation protein B [Rhodobacter viridis]PYF12951.1 disulfide bond formation protein DsbB [Rhodobacter viridis]
MDPVLTPRRLVALAAAGSAAVLVAALIFQALGFPPCELCILQRWPHLVAAVLGGLMLLFRLPMAFAPFGALAALTTGAFGIYHSGVERHIFAGPDTCTSNPIASLSAQDLMAQISSAPLIRCDEIAWDLFGVTMPNLNAVFSLCFAGLWIAAFLTARRTRG